MILYEYFNKITSEGYVWSLKEGDYISALENKINRIKNTVSLRGKNRGKNGHN